MAQDDYLEKGYHIDRYHAIEEELLRFLEFIPLNFYPSIEERQRIRSTYLADLLLRIGSNIDIFFKKTIERYSEIERWKERIALMTRKDWNGYKELEPILKLSDKYVNIISTQEKLFPFRLEGKSDGLSWSNKQCRLGWWSSYNKVKHEGQFDQATLDNVMQSLAALHLLIDPRDNNKNILIKLMHYEYIPIAPEFRAMVYAGKAINPRTRLITKIFY